MICHSDRRKESKIAIGKNVSYLKVVSTGAF